MELNKFLTLLEETLEHEGSIDINDNLSDIETWDSLGVLSIVSMLNDLGLDVEIEKFETLETIKDFVDLVGIVDD